MCSVLYWLCWCYERKAEAIFLWFPNSSTELQRPSHRSSSKTSCRCTLTSSSRSNIRNVLSHLVLQSLMSFLLAFAIVWLARPLPLRGRVWYNVHPTLVLAAEICREQRHQVPRLYHLIKMATNCYKKC